MQLNQFIYTILFIGIGIIVFIALLGWLLARISQYFRRKRQIQCRICRYRYFDEQPRSERISHCPHCGALNKR